mgnify:CR=1 FL=1
MQQGIGRVVFLRDAYGAYGSYLFDVRPYAEFIQQQAAAIGDGQRARIGSLFLYFAGFEHHDV